MVSNFFPQVIQTLISIVMIYEKCIKQKQKKDTCDSILGIPYYNEIPHSQLHIVEHLLMKFLLFKLAMFSFCERKL